MYVEKTYHNYVYIAMLIQLISKKGRDGPNLCNSITHPHVAFFLKFHFRVFLTLNFKVGTIFHYFWKLFLKITCSVNSLP